MQLTTQDGRAVRLGPRLGRGGEGDIYTIAGDDGHAAKIFTVSDLGNREAKVRAMIGNRLSERTPFVTFPLQVLLSNGRFAGYVMKKVPSARNVEVLFFLSERQHKFPDADFRFLVHCALNFARAVGTVHGLGAIIGDVNERGAMVDHNGLVTLIDSDSFHYAGYRCEVGTEFYTPPELQGQSLGRVDHVANHDAFGLAVVIFQLLFLGRHPFSGIYKGPGGQPTTGAAIRDGRFAYSPHRARTMMEPPPFLPVLTDIPIPVANAFMRAFGATLGQQRPTPAEWVTLLDAMQKNLVGCKTTPAHFYSREATNCPWCRFDAGFGTVVFLAKGPMPGDRSTFDLDLVLSRINAIANPGPAPDLVSMMPAANIRPSSVARDFQTRRIMKKVAGAGVAVLSVFLMMNKVGWAFFGFLPAGILFFSDTQGANDLKASLTKAQHDWNRALGDWTFDAGSGRFDRKKNELLETANKYRELPSVERDMLRQLELRKQELQMRVHLENKKIALARIPNIGDSRTMTLRSFGIQTAFDVAKSRVMNVPGFGPSLTDNLLSWKRKMEAEFKFNPNQPTDPVEVAKVRSDIATRRAKMESELLQGPGGLDAIRTAAMAKRRAYADHSPLYVAFLQAQADASVI